MVEFRLAPYIEWLVACRTTALYDCDVISGSMRFKEKWSLGKRSVCTVPESCDDTVLVNVGVYVRSVDEDADSSSDCHSEEDVQLKTINHHCYIAPIFQHLTQTSIT